jgi:hypothetical protein
VIVDTAGRRPLAQLRRALTRKGTLVIVGGDGGGPWTRGFFRGVLRAPLLSLFAGQKLCGLNAKVNQEDLRTVGELIEAGKVTPVIDRSYPLVETPEALRYLEGATERQGGHHHLRIIYAAEPTERSDSRMVLVGKAVGHDGHHAQVTIPGDHGLVVRERFVVADGPAPLRDPGAGAPPPICGAEIWEAFDRSVWPHCWRTFGPCRHGGSLSLPWLPLSVARAATSPPSRLGC